MFFKWGFSTGAIVYSFFSSLKLELVDLSTHRSFFVSALLLFLSCNCFRLEPQIYIFVDFFDFSKVQTSFEVIRMLLQICMMSFESLCPEKKKGSLNCVFNGVCGVVLEHSQCIKEGMFVSKQAWFKAQVCLSVCRFYHQSLETSF